MLPDPTHWIFTKLIVLFLGRLRRYGLRLARISSTRLWPLLLLLSSSHLLHLWHIQTHLYWFVLVLRFRKYFKINLVINLNRRFKR